jgi:hypothetical protein
VILSVNPKANIIDITHQIPAWDILKGAFVLNGFYKYFPKGTIHLTVVDPTVGSKRKGLLIKTKDYFFVGPDNGVFSFIYENKKIEEILEIKNRKFFLGEKSHTFHARDVFAPICAYLSLGTKIGEFGLPTGDCIKLKIPYPEIKSSSIKGEIVYIDSFGNLLTNISSKHLKAFSEKGFTVSIGNRKINKIAKSYCEAKPKEVLALIGSSGFLEISIREDRADKILGRKLSVLVSSREEE